MLSCRATVVRTIVLAIPAIIVLLRLSLYRQARQYLKHFLQHGGKDGLMDFAEFKRTFPSMDAKSQREMFALMDVDHDGRIEFHEFLVRI